MRTLVITLIGPERTADLVVDADTPMRELLPSLLTAGGVSASGADDLWGVALTGKQPLEPDRTLEQAGVLDGAVLVLRRMAETPIASIQPAGAGAEPAGSPLERTRGLLQEAISPPGRRRGRLRAPVPIAELSPDGRRAALEAAVGLPSTNRCVTIAVVSPKGGVGKTTLSVVLGETLCRLRDDEILALDADSDYGSLGRLAPAATGNGPPTGREGAIFADLAQGAVTFAELDRTLWALPGGLRVVPSPRDPTAMARADRAVYSRVIGNLQRLASVLIIDCGTGLGQPGVQAAILASDQLVVVTDATGATASLVAEATMLLERAGRPITVVGNRLRRGRAGNEDLQRLDAMFPRAAGLVGLAEEPEAERALRGELDLSQASRALQSAGLELACALVAGWTELGLAGPGSAVTEMTSDV